MKAIVYRRHGEPAEVLVPADLPEPSLPGPGEIAVRVVKRMVHPLDELLVRGYIPAPIPPEGAIPGVDGVAIVERVGSGIASSTGIVVGARVLLFPAHGSWSERLVIPAATAVPLPDDVSDAVACQIGVNGITALILMRAARAADSEVGVTSPVLVTAAGSGVGRNLIALARMQGLKVIALVRSGASAEILAQSFKGLDVITTNHGAWPAVVAAAYGEAPSVVVDPIGGEMTSHLLDVLADGGTLINYGGLDVRPSTISTINLAVRGLAIRGVNSLSWGATTSPEQRTAGMKDLFAMTRHAPLNFTEYREFPLGDAASALTAAQATPRRGAIILTSGD